MERQPRDGICDVEVAKKYDKNEMRQDLKKWYYMQVLHLHFRT